MSKLNFVTVKLLQFGDNSGVDYTALSPCWCLESWPNLERYHVYHLDSGEVVGSYNTDECDFEFYETFEDLVRSNAFLGQIKLSKDETVFYFEAEV